MEAQDQQAFFDSLNLIAEFFCDPLSDVRQRLYWEVFLERCTLAEWHWACISAMSRETFHKVPLPAVLFEYIKEYRKSTYALRQEQGQAERRRTEQKLLDQRILSQEEMQQQLATLFAQLGERVSVPAQERTPRDRAYLEPLAEGDYEERKARLLQQVQQLQQDAEDTHDGT